MVTYHLKIFLMIHQYSTQSDFINFFIKQTIENQQTCKGICYIVLSCSFACYRCLVSGVSYTSRQNPRDFYNMEEWLLWMERWENSISCWLILGKYADEVYCLDTAICRTLQSLLSAMEVCKSPRDTAWFKTTALIVSPKGWHEMCAIVSHK